MGYFSSEAEMDRYEEIYCQRCVHQINCPIMIYLHYPQPNEGARFQEILDMFIYRSGEFVNDECSFFVPVSSLTTEAVDSLRRESWRKRGYDLPIIALREVGIIKGFEV